MKSKHHGLGASRNNGELVTLPLEQLTYIWLLTQVRQPKIPKINQKSAYIHVKICVFKKRLVMVQLDMYKPLNHHITDILPSFVLNSGSGIDKIQSRISSGLSQ